jgi:hypothetical protein
LVIDPRFWRELRLVMAAPGGGRLDMVLLRDLAWLAAHQADLGNWLALDLEEMAIRGAALVVAIGPCPEIEEGEGRLVTGTFRYSHGRCYELTVEGEADALGVTGTHPFWSVDRRRWVMVRDLRVAECLLGRARPLQVLSLHLCEQLEPVYNMEVEGEHCYLVGQQRLLVHNASGYCPNADEMRCANLFNLGEYCNDPDFQRRYPYGSSNAACAAIGKTAGPATEMDETGYDCDNSRNSRHSTCQPIHPNHDSAISCLCCAVDGDLLEKWKLARQRS